MSDNQSILDKWRLPIAMTLSLGIVAVWFWYSQNTAEKEIKARQAFLAGSVSNTVISNTAPTVSTSPTLVSGVPNKNFKRVSETNVTLENKELKISFSSSSAVMTEAWLKSPVPGKSELPVSLEAGTLPGFETGALSFSKDLSQATLSPGFEITEQGSNFVVFKTPLEIQGKTFQLIKRYELKKHDVGLTLRLEGDLGALSASSLYLFNGSAIGPHLDAHRKTTFDENTIISVNGSDYQKHLASSIFSGNKTFESTTQNPEWIALHNRFYFRALKPEQKNLQAHFVLKTASATNYQIGMFEIPLAGRSGLTSFESRFDYFFLPKNRDLLTAYFEKNNVQWFQIFDQWAINRVLSGIIYQILIWIAAFTHSYGLSIILITALVKLLTWPLTQSGLKSMMKMQALNPKIEDIRKKYKDNSAKVNQEMMELYRKEKINPVAGCLPMFIPIPIFIAMYSLFRNMVELDQQTFLWIADLGLPDTVYRFPEHLALIGGLNFNVLPIVMTITSLLQSITTPQPSSGGNAQQALLFKYGFPIMFLFICWNMPSALVLFWTLQNLFSFLQTMLTKKPTLSAVKI